MITRIEINQMRGIHQGVLDGIGPLTVLVGPSGSGKSTILDAVLIAASPDPGDAVGRVVRRRAELPQGAPWLFERKGSAAEVVVHMDGDVRKADLQMSLSSAIRVAVGPITGPTHYTAVVGFNEARSDNAYHVSNSYHNQLPGFVRLVEAAAGANHAPLVRVFNYAQERGRLDSIRKLIAEMLDGARDLRIGTYVEDGRDVPLLHVDYGDHTVPVAGSGSGIYAIIRLALELAAVDDGLVLVEEPEAHQHPSVVYQTARVLLAAARRNVQVIVSTHSNDLIDALLSEATAADKGDLERLSVIRVVLEKGILRTSRFTGEMAQRLDELGEDLR